MNGFRKYAFALGAAVLLSGAGFAAPANAKGCIKGAIVGGVAGHMAGHGKLGAVAGCAIGHHHASKAKKKAAGSAQGGSGK
ncbi:MAG TPA: hypothetical protein VND97_01790 [Beijerinckiaceae bacterium]|nr:hypothetical protein [Beijerinckiaceae bacterium]